MYHKKREEENLHSKKDTNLKIENNELVTKQYSQTLKKPWKKIKIKQSEDTLLLNELSFNQTFHTTTHTVCECVCACVSDLV